MNLIEFYVDAYSDPAYAMKMDRQWNLAFYLKGLPGLPFPRRTFMDIGCGRAESLVVAASAGFLPAGAEIVPQMCGPAVRQITPGEDLPFPDAAFDVVTCIDVLEHVPAEWIPLMLSELHRITSGWLYLGICTRPGRGHLLVQSAEDWEIAIESVLSSPPGSMEFHRLKPEHRIENFVYFEVRR